MTQWQYYILTIWHFDDMRFWQYEILTIWYSDIMTFWQYDILTIWLYDNMTFWQYDNMPSENVKYTKDITRHVLLQKYTLSVLIIKSFVVFLFLPRFLLIYKKAVHYTRIQSFTLTLHLNHWLWGGWVKMKKKAAEHMRKCKMILKLMRRKANLISWRRWVLSLASSSVDLAFLL